MKAVKMLGLTGVMSNTIQNLRKDEIETSKTFRKLLVATLMLCKMSSWTKVALEWLIRETQHSLQ